MSIPLLAGRCFVELCLSRSPEGVGWCFGGVVGKVWMGARTFKLIRVNYDPHSVVEHMRKWLVFQ